MEEEVLEIEVTGCNKCPFVENRNSYCSVGRTDDQGLNINGDYINGTVHSDCPLLLKPIKVKVVWNSNVKS